MNVQSLTKAQMIAVLHPFVICSSIAKGNSASLSQFLVDKSMLIAAHLFVSFYLFTNNVSICTRWFLGKKLPGWSIYIFIYFKEPFLKIGASFAFFSISRIPGRLP